MKLIRTAIIYIFSLGVILGITSPSLAIPNLQIYSPQGTYDTESETWIIESYEYDLWVISAQLNVYDVKLAFAVPTDEDGYIEVEWIDPLSADYGDGDISSLILDEYNAMEYELYRETYESGDPDPSTYGFGIESTPIMGDGSSVPPHGVFPTDFYEYFIGDLLINEEDPETVYNYIPGDEWLDSALGDTKKFHITVGGEYTWVDIVAYDHVILSNNKAKYRVTPFSHDGGSGSPVPEPATMLLLGSGLVGLGIFGKRFRKGIYYEETGRERLWDSVVGKKV